MRVTCIQRSHVPVRLIAPGQTATLALQAVSGGLPHSGSKQALLTAAAVAQAAAAEAAAREAAAAIAAVPEPIAKTRRRSPAALKAAAAAAASTAATAAAAAEAARRAAETAGGKAWWVRQQQQQRAAGMEHQQDRAACSAAVIPAGQCAEAAVAAAAVAGAQDSGNVGAAADYVADLLDDADLAAGLAADDSGSDTEADLFGSIDDQPRARSNAAAAATQHRAGMAADCAAAGNADDDLFAGLVGVFDDGDGDGDADEQPSPGRDASSTTSSTDGLLSNSWSFSSASSTCGPAAAAASTSCTSRYASSASRHAGSTAASAAAAAAQPIAISASGHRGFAGRVPSRSSVSDAALFGSSPSRVRNKGGVLLAAAAAPHTYWEFEALLVLLGGHWPARGLLSGCWPPGQHAAADAAGGAPDASATAASEGQGSEVLDHVGPSSQQGEPGQQLLLKEQVEGQAQPAQQQEQPQQQQPAAHRARKQRSSNKRLDFAYVVHCNSIRQIARVVCMQELRQHADDEEADLEHVSSSNREVDGTAVATEVAGPDSAEQQQQGLPRLQQHCGLTASIRAAAALLQGASSAAAPSDKEASLGSASGDSSSSSGGSRQRQRARVAAGAGNNSSSVTRRCSDAGSVVSVRFRFTHRPEWMQAGARMIVRDRSDGHVAAAGFVTQLLEPHVQLQQQQQHQKAGVGAQC